MRVDFFAITRLLLKLVNKDDVLLKKHIFIKKGTFVSKSRISIKRNAFASPKIISRDIFQNKLKYLLARSFNYLG